MMSSIRKESAANGAAAIIVLALAAFVPRSIAAPPAGEDDRPVLQVPVLSGPAPVIDGRLDEPCWQQAVAIGPLTPQQGEPATSTTKALVWRDADHLYVGVTCEVNRLAPDTTQPAEPPAIMDQEHVALLIDSNHDRNSYYLIILTERGTLAQVSYNEHSPPWHDPTWNRRKPRFQCHTASGEGTWSAEFAVPFEIFDKSKSLTSEIGFNIRRHNARAAQTHCWRGEFSNPADAGVLAGIPTREYPTPPPVNYAGMFQLDGGYRQGFNMPSDPRPAGAAGPIQLGPGSAHPGTTGEVRIELEEFLMGGNVHARALIWDLAVDERDRLREQVDRLTGDLVRLARRASDLPERKPEQRAATKQPPRPLPTELRNLISGFDNPIVQYQMEHEVRNQLRAGASPDDLVRHVREQLGVEA